MRTISGFLACAGFGLALVVAAAPASAIINGTFDTGTEAVGVVTDGVTAMNSAVLIDPWWVLTSATFATAVTDGWFAVGQDCAAPDSTYPFSVIFPHPGFYPDSGADDLALIRLAVPVAGVTPIATVTASAPTIGAQVRYVGYGATSTSDFDNTRRHSCVNVVDFVGPTTFMTSYDGAGPYFGDGGGPALLSADGVTRVVGIIAATSLDGMGVTMATRVSSYAAFIADVMEANPPVSAVSAPDLPLRLLGAAPNPFNPRTEIAFVLDAPATCRLAVYDLRGREVAMLADRPFATGRHAVAWDGRDAAGGAAASGTYLVRLKAGGAVRTGKVVLAK